MDQTIITLTEVSKVFRLNLGKRKTAVDKLTLSIPRGKVIGLLGPNGSGKSTTLKMILGFLSPSQGEILVGGHRASELEARRHLGYLPENPRFQRFLTARQILGYYGSLLGLGRKKLAEKTTFLLELVGLKTAVDERVSGFSKGMTQRLAIAQALLNDPSILIFDEPMSGLDPLGRYEIRRLIKRIHEEHKNATILFSTHILTDVEELCSEVALLKKGRLVTYTSIGELLTTNQERYDVITQVSDDSSRKLIGAYEHESTASGMVVTLKSLRELVQFLKEVEGAGARVVGISSHRRTLETALFGEGA